MENGTREKCLVAASTLAWLIGVIGLLGFALGIIPVIFLNGRTFIVPVLSLALGLLYCLVGYALRNKMKVGGVIGMAISSCSLIISIPTILFSTIPIVMKF